MKKSLVIVCALLLSCPTIAGAVTFSWTDRSTNEDGFRCERQANGGSFFQVCDVGADVQAWVDVNTLPNITYCYRVLAYNAAGVSGYSNTACLTTGAATAGMSQVACLYVPSPPVSSGLVLALNFNEGMGATVADISGNNNHGTLVNGPIWTTAGRHGGALLFDGVNDSVVVAHSASLVLSSTGTMSAWVYPTVAPSGWRAVLTKELPNGSSYFLYAGSTSSNSPAVGVSIAGIEQQLFGGARLVANTWTHLAATYDGAQMRLYVNGAQVASRAQTGTLETSTSPLRIGGHGIYGEYFQGRIDDVRVYNRVLTQTEIQTDMNTPLLP